MFKIAFISDTSQNSIETLKLFIINLDVGANPQWQKIFKAKPQNLVGSAKRQMYKSVNSVQDV